ncbi:hypothetical protein OAP59_01255 [Flavobacteriales bacterium]|nr:hypothetical protein [Flavobacteriales bacterium]
MKHLITCLALSIAFAAGAQTGLVEFPYNPDSDGDDLIGTADLLDLLALYGLEFSEEDLYLNDDSTTAIYYAGSMMFSDCFRNCSQLPSNWKIPSAEQIMQFDLSMLNTSALWLDGPMSYHPEAVSTKHYTIGTGDGGNEGRIMHETYDLGYINCYCYTKERPKVEYSYCEGFAYSNGDSFLDCAVEKVEDGWHPLCGISSSIENGTQRSTQAFWRWAE